MERSRHTVVLHLTPQAVKFSTVQVDTLQYPHEGDALHCSAVSISQQNTLCKAVSLPPF
jgi:hypothetical protein